jgi:hypothetical protein
VFDLQQHSIINLINRKTKEITAAPPIPPLIILATILVPSFSGSTAE